MVAIVDGAIIGLVLRILRTVEQTIKLLMIVLCIYELPWENSLAVLEVLIRVQYILVLAVQVLFHVKPYPHVVVTLLFWGVDTCVCIHWIQFQHLQVPSQLYSLSQTILLFHHLVQPHLQKTIYLITREIYTYHHSINNCLRYEPLPTRGLFLNSTTNNPPHSRHNSARD